MLFNRQKEGYGSRRLLAKGKIFFRPCHLFGRVGMGGGFIMQMTSLVLIKKLKIDCLKVTSLGKIETTIKCWFTVMGTNNSI